jgi:hypothetical protein
MSGIPFNISTTSLNKAMQLNLGCLLFHLLLYTSVPAVLLSRHNPFGELVVALSIAAGIGLWLCLDFMIPMYMEAKMGRFRNISRPTGWLVSLNLLALGGISTLLVI